RGVITEERAAVAMLRLLGLPSGGEAGRSLAKKLPLQIIKLELKGPIYSASCRRRVITLTISNALQAIEEPQRVGATPWLFAHCANPTGDGFPRYIGSAQMHLTYLMQQGRFKSLYKVKFSGRGTLNAFDADAVKMSCLVRRRRQRLLQLSEQPIVRGVVAKP